MACWLIQHLIIAAAYSLGYNDILTQALLYAHTGSIVYSHRPYIHTGSIVYSHKPYTHTDPIVYSHRLYCVITQTLLYTHTSPILTQALLTLTRALLYTHTGWILTQTLLYHSHINCPPFSHVLYAIVFSLHYARTLLSWLFHCITHNSLPPCSLVTWCPLLVKHHSPLHPPHQLLNAEKTSSTDCHRSSNYPQFANRTPFQLSNSAGGGNTKPSNALTRGWRKT